MTAYAKIKNGTDIHIMNTVPISIRAPKLLILLNNLEVEGVAKLRFAVVSAVPLSRI